jgi:hypothetical protein
MLYLTYFYNPVDSLRVLDKLSTISSEVNNAFTPTLICMRFLGTGNLCNFYKLTTNNFNMVAVYSVKLLL